jgi:hypothetical protein
MPHERIRLRFVHLGQFGSHLVDLFWLVALNKSRGESHRLEVSGIVTPVSIGVKYHLTTYRRCEIFPLTEGTLAKDKYESYTVTTLTADGKLVSEEVVVVPLHVSIWVSIVVAVRKAIVFLSRGFLRVAESLLSLADTLTEAVIPSQLLVNRVPEESTDEGKVP